MRSPAPALSRFVHQECPQEYRTLPSESSKPRKKNNTIEEGEGKGKWKRKKGKNTHQGESSRKGKVKSPHLQDLVRYNVEKFVRFRASATRLTPLVHSRSYNKLSFRNALPRAGPGRAGRDGLHGGRLT